MKPEQIREQITKSIIETLEKGDVPFWKRGWSDDSNGFGLGTSLSTGKPYSGINQWICHGASGFLSGGRLVAFVTADSVSCFIQIPFESQFESREHYYGTLAHECIHASEKHIGIDRSKIDNAYSFLELVAELGSAFLLGQLGIANQDLTNTSAYVSSWLKGMKGDTSFVLKAASTASKAVGATGFEPATSASRTQCRRFANVANHCVWWRFGFGMHHGMHQQSRFGTNRG